MSVTTGLAEALNDGSKVLEASQNARP